MARLFEPDKPESPPAGTIRPGDIRTEAQLAAYLLDTYGVVLPDVQVCPTHSTPWRAFKEAYFAESPVSVWKASRGFGGKSFTLSLLGLVEATTLSADVNVLGGSGEQSQRVLQAMDKLWAMPAAPRALLKSDPAKRETNFRAGNVLRALLASTRSVRGPHPQRLRMDEVDEVDLKILDAALGQTMSLQGVPAQTVLSSTHHYADGTMSTVIQRAKERGWPVHEWSIAQGTRVYTSRGWQPIETLRRGEDLAMTRSGWRRVRHVTLMGWKPVRTIRLASGHELRVTGDHQVSTPTGWVRAERLQLGDPLTSTTVGFPEADPTVPATIARGDIRVFGGVLMPLGAVGACNLCGDMGGAGHVDAVRDVLHVRGVAAGAVAADVVDLESDVTTKDAPSEAMRPLFAPRIHGSADDAVAITAAPKFPTPTVRLGVGNDPAGDVRGIHDDLRLATVSAIRTRLTPARTQRPEGLPALQTITHVASISDGAVLVPVWDIGVDNEHEFIAEGIVVHNCWRETLEPHGWLAAAEVARKRIEVTTAMWAAEYDLQEPSSDARAIVIEKVDAMFDLARGTYVGGDGEYIEVEAPVKGGRYATGADWARKRDNTVVVTLRIDVKPARLVAFERLNRRPWPTMVGRFNDRVKRYPGNASHDGTGVGDVVAGYLSVQAESFLMVGRDRADLLSEYINAIENGELTAPRIEFMYGEHKFASPDVVYGGEHPPDTLVAGALAYHASRGRGFFEYARQQYEAAQAAKSTEGGGT